MAKAYGQCKLCKINHFLNYAGLCKRCSRKHEGALLADEAFHQQEELFKEKKAEQKEKLVKEKAEESKEEEPAEDKKEEKKEN